MARETFRLRVRQLIAAFAVSGSTTAIAQVPPAPFPIAAPSAPAEEPVEIYYGAIKLPAPASMVEASLVVTASASSPARKDEPKSAEAFVAALHSVRDGTRDITAATVGLLGTVGTRVRHTAESRPIILATYAMPASSATMQPSPAATNAPASQPQIVVVREAAPTTAVEPRITLHLESLLAFGVGILGVLFAAIVWARSSRTVARSALPSAIAPPVSFDPNLVQLFGQYNAGPKREPAEKFDLGPTYLDDVQQKIQMEAASNTAAVEFILNQNLALLTALNSMEPEAAAPALA